MLNALAATYIVLTIAVLAAMARSPERTVSGLLPAAWQLSGIALAIAVLAG